MFVYTDFALHRKLTLEKSQPLLEGLKPATFLNESGALTTELSLLPIRQFFSLSFIYPFVDLHNSLFVCYVANSLIYIFFYNSLYLTSYRSLSPSFGGVGRGCRLERNSALNRHEWSKEYFLLK